MGIGDELNRFAPPPSRASERAIHLPYKKSAAACGGPKVRRARDALSPRVTEGANPIRRANSTDECSRI